MKTYSLMIVGVLCVALLAGCAPQPVSDDTVVAPAPIEEEEVVVSSVTVGTGSELVTIATPSIESVVTSPLSITGSMPGYWFFEATAPVRVEDNDGMLLGQSYVSATEPRMTESLVGFSGSVTFSLTGTTATGGVLILSRNNASGMIENDGYVEVPISFY